MQKFKFFIGILALGIVTLGVIFVLRSENTLVAHPKGLIAHQELSVISTQLLLMLIIILPTAVLLLVTAWRYRARNGKAKRNLDQKHRPFHESILWVIPACVVAVMIAVTWNATHELDPYRPLESDTKPLTIQVVALDWKWLFIYPEQGIATVNFVQFPEHTPIHFELSADGSPMNSFWIPQLSGQIYSMAGMTTQLHLIADEPGVYAGRAAEINGRGFADMTFTVKATPHAEFEQWVTEVKRSPLALTDPLYEALVKPTQKHPVVFYSSVDAHLFHKIVMKGM